MLTEDAPGKVISPPPTIPGIKVPGTTAFSLEPLLRQYEVVAAGNGETARHAARLLKQVRAVGAELRGPIHDPATIEKHRTLIDDLFSIIIPPGRASSASIGAMVPFTFEAVASTRGFSDIFSQPAFTAEDAILANQCIFRSLGPYVLILERMYDVILLPPNERQFTFHLVNPINGLDSYLQLRLNFDFIDVLPEIEGEPPSLTTDMRKQIAEEALSLELLDRVLPPIRYRFEGFTLCEMNDVTTQELLVALRQELMHSDCLARPERVQVLEQRLRSLLRLPRLAMRMAMFDGDSVHFKSSPESKRILPGCNVTMTQLLDTECSGELIRGRTPVTIDLAVEAEDDSTLIALQQAGYAGMMRAPLVLDDNVVGILDLVSDGVEDFNALNRQRCEGVLAMMALSVRRALDARGVKVQAAIKELFTAIHPAIEWRFRQVATTYLMGRSIEPPVFEDVYPLFGVSDVRSSSTLRSKAIQEDMLDQLRSMRAVLDEVDNARHIPFVRHLAYKLRKKIEKIEPGLSSGDEVSIIDFLRFEVEPLLPRFEALAPQASEAIARYRAELDDVTHIVYHRRRDFEVSVSRLSDSIAEILAEQQRDVQELFPHYFEMHKTDGVDHSVYVGGSMSPQGKFDLLYLKNLRLWQLITMCIVARRCEALRAEMPMPLETAHLVLVQNTPLTIRFSLDEKQFTVDGAYNIRYEIMKKRLDKAVVHGTGERLTQPKKLAVVYSQPREAEEYRGYLGYLVDAGYAETDVEDLELDPLPGVNGLKALRFGVRMD